MSTMDLKVEGMSCGACVKHVTQALQPLAGVSAVEVDLSSGHVRVSGELSEGSAPFIAALAVKGYPAKLATSSVSIPPPKTSGCCSGSADRGGCCG